MYIISDELKVQLSNN